MRPFWRIYRASFGWSIVELHPALPSASAVASSRPIEINNKKNGVSVAAPFKRGVATLFVRAYIELRLRVGAVSLKQTSERRGGGLSTFSEALRAMRPSRRERWTQQHRRRREHGAARATARRHGTRQRTSGRGCGRGGRRVWCVSSPRKGTSEHRPGRAIHLAYLVHDQPRLEPVRDDGRGGGRACGLAARRDRGDDGGCRRGGRRGAAGGATAAAAGRQMERVGAPELAKLLRLEPPPDDDVGCDNTRPRKASLRPAYSRRLVAKTITDGK